LSNADRTKLHQHFMLLANQGGKLLRRLNHVKNVLRKGASRKGFFCHNGISNNPVSCFILRVVFVMSSWLRYFFAP
jgi:hypothetical protein